MNFIGPNHPDITLIAGQSLLNFTFKLKVSDLEDNKAFKEAESLNTINDISDSN